MIASQQLAISSLDSCSATAAATPPAPVGMNRNGNVKCGTATGMVL
jgi:hypothetical protein